MVGRDGAPLATWTVGGPGYPDLAVVDGLASLALVAGRRGNRVIVTEASTELAELLELVGLTGQVLGQPEEGEQLRVEKAMVPGDPAP